ncbi:hypothetical protein [Caldimonas sp. KR1-144]|uniref:hypothetical protein n=1 Tax=Caldimonas sp. KR1-144 TaxID=3400911 RepID=UPI003BFFF1B8
MISSFPRLATLLAPAAAAVLIGLAAPAQAAPPGWIVVEEIPGTPDAKEPNVRRTTIEDDNARVEELRVRGAVKRITVKPKHGPKGEYEVVPVDAGRDPSEGPANARGTTGQARWQVLEF